MSFDLVYLIRRRNFSRPAIKAVIMEMAHYARDDGAGIWASVDAIAAGSGLKRTAAKSAIRDLIELGLIAFVGPHSGKHGDTNEFALNVAAVKALPANRLEKRQPEPGRETTITRSGNDPLPGRETTPIEESIGQRKIPAPKANRSEVQSREPEHLVENDDFANWLGDQRARAHG